MNKRRKIHFGQVPLFFISRRKFFVKRRQPRTSLRKMLYPSSVVFVPPPFLSTGWVLVNGDALPSYWPPPPPSSLSFSARRGLSLRRRPVVMVPPGPFSIPFPLSAENFPRSPCFEPFFPHRNKGFKAKWKARLSFSYEMVR